MVNNQDLEEKVAQLAEPVVAELGYELVEVQYRREQHGQILRIIIFKPSGVGIDDCSKVSREVSNLLDVEELIDEQYSLEVSSPGLDRPLVTARDFARYKGARIKLFELDQPEPLTGVILEAGGENVVIDTVDGQVSVALSNVNKAKLIIEINRK